MNGINEALMLAVTTIGAPFSLELGELSSFALAIGFSPLHIGVLLLVLVGPNPTRRGSLFVAGWLVTSVLVVTLLLTIGHGLLLDMAKGSSHRTGLDLMAAGALLALGLRELLSRQEEGETPGWTRQLDRLCAMPLPLLLPLSAALQVASPENAFLYAKAAGSLLSGHLDRGQELVATGLFAVVSDLLLLLPLLGLLLLGSERVVPLLQAGKSWLFRRGDLLVGLVCIALAVLLGSQGLGGLRLT